VLKCEQQKLELLIKMSFFNRISDILIVHIKKSLSKKKQQNIYVICSED